MSEQKRNNLTSLGTNKKDKKSKELSKTVRFTLNLPESNEEACPEFNYRVLLSSAEKKRKSKLTKGDGHVNGVDPLADDDDNDKLKEFARQLEEKYGGGGRKKHGRFEGYVDLGAGYDENDPFIDNTDAYDEVVPEEITTAHGGFYINCGELEFKEVSDQSDGEEVKDLKAKKRVKKTFNAIEDDDGDDAAEGVKVSNVLQASKKPKAQEENNEELIKKRKFVAHDREILKKKKKRAIDDLMRKKAVTVKELLREKREYLEIEPTAAVTESAQEQKKPVVNCLPKPTNTSIVDVIESVVSAARADDDSSKDSTSSVSKSVSGSVVSTDTEASQDAEVGEKEKSTPKEEVKLPEAVPDELRELVVLLRKAASSSADGKCKFFSIEVNQMLLKVEQKCQALPCHSRHLVYGHLACYLPCTKDTLQKRAKKLRLLAEEVKIQEPLKKLEVAVASMMPSVMDKYSRECQRIAEEKSVDDPSSPSSEPEGEGGSPAEGAKSLKPLRAKAKIPRRRFPWTTELRALLCDVVRIKLQCLVLKKPRKETGEEQLRTFLDQQVKPLWPAGWIKVTSLLRESRQAQTTALLKSKKIVLATKKQPPSLSLPLVPPSVSVPSTTTSVSATTTTTATITANNSTVRAPKGTTPPVPVAASRPPVPVPVPVAASRPPVPVAASRPPVPVAASRPPVPVVASRPPVPVAASRPPVPVVASRPPVPAASRPLVPVAAFRPLVPVAASRPPVPVVASRPPVPVVASRPPVPAAAVKLKPVSAVPETSSLPRPVVSSTSVLVVPPTSVTMTVTARSTCSPVSVVAKSSVLPSVAVPRAKLPVETFVKMPTAAVKTVPNTNLERQPTAIVRTISNTNPDRQSPVQPMQSSPEVTLSKGNIDRVPVKGLDLSMSGASRPSTVPSAQNKVKSVSELSIIPVSVSSSSSAHKSPVAALPLINIPDCISVTPSLPSPSQAVSVTVNPKPMMSLKQRILFDTAKERSNSSVNIVNTNMQPCVNNKDDGIEVIEIVDHHHHHLAPNPIKLNSFKVGNQKQRSVKSEVSGKPKTEAKKKKKVEGLKESIITSVSQVTSEPKPTGPPLSEKEAERRFNEETAAATDVLSQIINESLPDLPNSSRKEIYHNEENPRKELNRQEEKQRKEIHYGEDKPKMEVYLEDKIKKDDKPRKEVNHQEENSVVTQLQLLANTHCSGSQKSASPPPCPISCESKNGPYAEDELEWSEEAGDEKLKCDTPQPADTEVSVQLEVDRVMKELIELQGHMSGGKEIDGSDTKYSSSKISSSVSVNPLSSAVISRSHQQKSAKELDSPVVTCKPVLNTRRPSSGSEFSAAAKFSHGFQEEFQKHLFQDVPKQDLEPVSFQIGKSKGQIKPIAIHSRSSSPEGSNQHSPPF